jgi:Bacterial Alpha-2-macroglobulin MG10 domain/Alpha-2-macroglobulin family/MG2 domain
MKFTLFRLQFVLIAISIFFVFNSASAQVVMNDYRSQWKKVDNLITKKLTKSALDEVGRIYTIAKKDKNAPQVIKALVYRVTLVHNIEEDADVKSIVTIEKEIATAKEPAKSILYSIAAEMYWNFFKQNRYKLYNRTTISPRENLIKDDIQTWSIADFHKKIGELYLASIKEDKLLQQTRLETFEPVLIKGNARYLRPALFDLLAHRALEYFKNDERDIIKPAYAFVINDQNAFADAREFVSHKFVNKDSSSLHYYALLIFQKLLGFHAIDIKPDALIDADIERIDFGKQYGVMNGKIDLYIKALENIGITYKNIPASTQAGYLMAQEIFNQASAIEVNAEEKKTKYTIEEAKEIAEGVMQKFPGSEGAINAKNLLNQILHKELNLTSEKVNIPDEPFRTLVSYKNFSSLNFRIIQLTPEFKKLVENNNDNDQLWKKLTVEKFMRSWKQSFPSIPDYRTHSCEIKIDALPVGEYALLASVEEDFGMNKNPLAAQYFHISNISYINNGTEYFVLHRETGKPLPGATVQVWSQKYDYNTSKNILEKQELLTTDKNGYIKLSDTKKNENRNLRLEITWQNDRLFLNDYQYSYSYYSEDETNPDSEKYEAQNAKIFLFTDRSIYRPGQLVYFKGIGITKELKNKRPQLLSAKDPILVILTDANNQKIDSLKLMMNDFGSFNGKFHLPENKLNGLFRIETVNYNNSAVNFSVEEYKRPKFYTDFEKVRGTYRVNDKITVTGFSKAYAGNDIDGATVKYRVTRIARFLYPWMFWRRGFPQSQPMEIANGEMKTGANGKFTIIFEAIPDLNIDKKTDPVFDYKVEADVTDINGETRSGNIIIPAGYKALRLQVNLPENEVFNVDSLKEISITTKNLSGEFEPTKVEVKVFTLISPQRLIRSRYWPEPDQFVMSKDEFLKYFPKDEYKDESKKETWPKGKMVFTKTDSTKPTFNLQLSTFNLTEGWYVVEATATDIYGQDVKDVKYFQLYNTHATDLPASAYSWNTTVANIVQPGEAAKFITGSSANDIFVIRQIDKRKTINPIRTDGQVNDNHSSTYQFYSLNNEKKNFVFPVTEDDRGGFGVYQFFVKDNRFYSNTWNISVPWTNKQLDISFETFRDKLLPGSEEKWKVKISGEKGQKIAAEMLAAMYDASLDQFKPHKWSSPDIWPNYNGFNGWSSTQNFTSVQSFQRWWNEEYIQPKGKVYDELVAINNDNYGIYNTRPMRADAAGAPGIKRNGINQREALVTGQDATDLGLANKQQDTVTTQNNIEPAIDQSQIQIRKNFNETAFFFPELRTDENGNIEFNFTVPEALTQWKLMTLAHGKDLSSGYAEKTVITQKELMVQPNPPRFVREGDKVEFTSKVVNSGSKEISGQAELELFNTSTMKPVDKQFKNISPLQHFAAGAGQSTVVKFSIEIPYNYNDALLYRIVARASGNSDGEESAIPVVTNRMLVTETMPLPLRGNTSKKFNFEKLLNSGKSETLNNYALTVEYTTNPAWYAIQALPYLAEPKYDCTDQLFNRYFANSLAQKIANSSPKIKSIFEKWRTSDTTALLSNLQKNEELKSVLLEETPWVLEAQDETLQKKNIAVLFDMVRLSGELESSLTKLKNMQSSNGGFVWFKGGPDDRYMTQYIATGIGHLKKISAFNKEQEEKLKIILDIAIPYLDKKLKQDFDDLIRHKVNLKGNNLNPVAIQYLYMHSFFPEYPVTIEIQSAYNYYREQAKKYCLSQSRYMQAMIALFLYRANDHITPQQIIRSLKENSIHNEETGMYWKEWNIRGYWWHQAPIESQAMMIEAFSEIDKDIKVIDDLKTWLLKNKQTNNWKTNRATAEACYALLLQGSDWLEEKDVTINLGGTIISSPPAGGGGQEGAGAGTGYFKRKIEGGIKPEMGNISVSVSGSKDAAVPSPKAGGEGPSWGAVYWQYFENLDKITFAETPLKLVKKLFIEKNTDRGPMLTPIDEGSTLHIGDKIKVRIELRVDRDMEYVHMKDMRASCMEPANVISEYKYQGGLGYYETTKDAGTNFFFGWLNKGTYVFEYPMYVTHSGNFSNGITTIQCMYAPEFTAHSEGVRVSVAE